MRERGEVMLGREQGGGRESEAQHSVLRFYWRKQRELKLTVSGSCYECGFHFLLKIPERNRHTGGYGGGGGQRRE